MEEVSQVFSREWHDPFYILNNNPANESFSGWKLDYCTNMGRVPNNKCISSVEKANILLIFPNSPQFLIPLKKCVVGNLQSHGHIRNLKYLLTEPFWLKMWCLSLLFNYTTYFCWHSFTAVFVLVLKFRNKIRFLCLLNKTNISWDAKKFEGI